MNLSTPLTAGATIVGKGKGEEFPRQKEEEKGYQNGKSNEIKAQFTY